MILLVVFDVELRRMWVGRIDPGHRRDQRRIIIRLVLQAVAPAVWIGLEGFTAEEDGALDGRVFPECLDLAGQLAGVLPGGSGGSGVSEERSQPDIALPAIGMA